MAKKKEVVHGRPEWFETGQRVASELKICARFGRDPRTYLDSVAEELGQTQRQLKRFVELYKFLSQNYKDELALLHQNVGYAHLESLHRLFKVNKRRANQLASKALSGIITIAEVDEELKAAVERYPKLEYPSLNSVARKEREQVIAAVVTHIENHHSEIGFVKWCTRTKDNRLPYNEPDLVFKNESGTLSAVEVKSRILAPIKREIGNLLGALAWQSMHFDEVYLACVDSEPVQIAKIVGEFNRASTKRLHILLLDLVQGEQEN